MPKIYTKKLEKVRAKIAEDRKKIEKKQKELEDNNQVPFFHGTPQETEFLDPSQMSSLSNALFNNTYVGTLPVAEEYSAIHHSQAPQPTIYQVTPKTEFKGINASDSDPEVVEYVDHVLQQYQDKRYNNIIKNVREQFPENSDQIIQKILSSKSDEPIGWSGGRLKNLKDDMGSYFYKQNKQLSNTVQELNEILNPSDYDKLQKIIQESYPQDNLGLNRTYFDSDIEHLKDSERAFNDIREYLKSRGYNAIDYYYDGPAKALLDPSQFEFKKIAQLNRTPEDIKLGRKKLDFDLENANLKKLAQEKINAGIQSGALVDPAYPEDSSTAKMALRNLILPAQKMALEDALEKEDALRSYSTGSKNALLQKHEQIDQQIKRLDAEADNINKAYQKMQQYGYSDDADVDGGPILDQDLSESQLNDLLHFLMKRKDNVIKSYKPSYASQLSEENAAIRNIEKKYTKDFNRWNKILGYDKGLNKFLKGEQDHVISPHYLNEWASAHSPVNTNYKQDLIRDIKKIQSKPPELILPHEIDKLNMAKLALESDLLSPAFEKKLSLSGKDISKLPEYRQDYYKNILIPEGYASYLDKDLAKMYSKLEKYIDPEYQQIRGKSLLGISKNPLPIMDDGTYADRPFENKYPISGRDQDLLEKAREEEIIDQRIKALYKIKNEKYPDPALEKSFNSLQDYDIFKDIDQDVEIPKSAPTQLPKELESIAPEIEQVRPKQLPTIAQPRTIQPVEEVAQEVNKISPRVNDIELSPRFGRPGQYVEKPYSTAMEDLATHPAIKKMAAASVGAGLVGLDAYNRHKRGDHLGAAITVGGAQLYGINPLLGAAATTTNAVRDRLNANPEEKIEYMKQDRMAGIPAELQYDPGIQEEVTGDLNQKQAEYDAIKKLRDWYLQ